MNKPASQPTPVRSSRTRVNRRSVQHQVAMWENAAQAVQLAGLLAGMLRQGGPGLPQQVPAPVAGQQGPGHQDPHQALVRPHEQLVGRRVEEEQMDLQGRSDPIQ